MYWFTDAKIHIDQIWRSEAEPKRVSDDIFKCILSMKIVFASNICVIRPQWVKETCMLALSLALVYISYTAFDNMWLKKQIAGHVHLKLVGYFALL